MDTQRTILFIIFSASLLLLWNSWQKEQHPAPSHSVVQTVPRADQAPTPQGKIGAAAPGAGVSPASLQRGERIRVSTDVLNAEIDTTGGDLRQLEFTKQRDAHDPKKDFVLLSDRPDTLYVAQSGFIGGALPTHKTPYTASATRYSLVPGTNKLQVRLEWHGNGIAVEKVYTFHRDSYLIDLSYTVRNDSGAALKPDAYYQMLRNGEPPKGEPRFVHSYTGAAVYTNKGKFEKISFKDIAKGEAHLPSTGTDGWIAVLQHYFLSAWLPPKGVQREFYTKQVGNDLYSVGVIVPVGTIASGASRTISMRLYAGPEEQDKIAALAPGLDLTVDYGWLTIIASPIFWVLAAIHKVVGNWGVAIILLTILIKLAFYPLSAKSYRSMAQMRVLTPKLQRLKEQYGDDRQKLHQAMMELYKTEKVNPLGGCLPVVVQIPVFIALYWVLLSTVELRQAPFALWIHDLSAPDPYYVLPIVMGLTMMVQMKLNPKPPDPIQAKVMMIMPLAFSIFFFFFPAGLVLYYLVNNVLSISQQWYITRNLERANARHGKR
jgi:YidC/Oxa1 family membrane protein insertase